MQALPCDHTLPPILYKTNLFTATRKSITREDEMRRGRAVRAACLCATRYLYEETRLEWGHESQAQVNFNLELRKLHLLFLKRYKHSMKEMR